MDETDRCIHCKVRKGESRRRMLCKQCHSRPGIKDKYPKRNSGPKKYREETLEDLDRMVEEQRANLPDWWPKTDSEWEWERLHGDDEKEE